MTFAAMTGDLSDGACEYNLVRTWRIADLLRVPTPLQARVLAAIQGAWAMGGEYGCKVAKGIHANHCFHRLNAVPVRVGRLAKWTFGHAGGSQVDELRNAIADLTELDIRFDAHAAGHTQVARGALISLIQSSRDEDHICSDDSTGDLELLLELNQQLRGDGMLPHDFIIRFAESVHAGLMAGRFQFIPGELVQRLHGADYLLWQAVLCQRPVASTKALGKPARFTLTGRRPAIRPWQVGCASLGPTQLRALVGRAAEHGNAAQSRYRIEPLDFDPHKGRRRHRVGLSVRRLKSR